MRDLASLGISPAPWKVTYLHHNTLSGDIYCVEVNADDTTGITSFDIDREQFSAEEASANANLIAAAPDCLMSLCDTLAALKNRLPSQPTIDELEIINRAEAAICKATGEADEVAK